MFKPPVFSTITDTALDSYDGDHMVGKSETGAGAGASATSPTAKTGSRRQKRDTKPNTKRVVRYMPLTPYPIPGKVRISTISAVSFLNADIDFPLFYERLQLVAKDDDTTGVFTIKQYTKDPETKRIVQAVRTRTVTKGDEETRKEVDKHFQNQITIIWKFRSSSGDIKTTNGFVFTNGKVKGVGLKCNEDIALSFEALRGCIERQLGGLADACTVLCDRGLDDEGHVEGISEEIVGVLQQEKQVACEATDAILATTSKVKSPASTTPHGPHTPLWLYGTRATMYNTDYSANFQIVREELFRIVLDECHLEESEFEPDIYPAVKIKFAWNHDYLHTSRAETCIPGVCYCTKRCGGKGTGRGNGECKVVTICVFGNDAPKRHDAKIIITGANSFVQVQEVYSYMNRVLENHYKEVFYREPYLEAVDETHVPITE